MALNDKKHVLEANCEYLGVPQDAKYPFRLVFFQKDAATDTYKASTTPQSWQDMGFAYPGLLPKLNEEGPLIPDPLEPLWRRNSFFGIISAQENLQPHDLNLDEIKGIEVCEEDGKVFMKKHGIFRMPVKAIFPNVRACQCNCGASYGATHTYGTSFGEPSVPNWMVAGNRDLLFTEHRGFTQTVSFSTGPIPNPAPPFFKETIYTGVYAVVVGIYSPQQTGLCAYAEPPVFIHPRCSIFEMQEYFSVSYSGFRAAITTILNPPFSVNTQETISLGDIQIGGRVGAACLYSGISDNTKQFWPGTEILYPEAPPTTGDDYPDGWEGPIFNFENFNATLNIVLTEPREGLHAACPPVLPCNCPTSIVPKYRPCAGN
jgi:hypothetical protein